MGVEFKHNGRLWRADSVEEAIALRQSLEAADRDAFEAGEEIDVWTERIWTPDAVNDLLQNAGHHQKKLLLALAEANGAISSDQILKKLSLSSEEALAGVLSGLSKQLKKLGIKTSDLYTVGVEWKGDGKTRSFHLDSNFTWAASQLGWPEKWK
jgi:hypothetical protein